MLDHLEVRGLSCFLDGYLAYNKISISPKLQYRTTFTYTYGMFAFKRMSFDLCNAPTTFQCWKISMFSKIVEDTIEVFIEYFMVVGD